MLKKIVITALVIAAFGFMAANLLVRKIPDLTVFFLERQLQKDVSVGTVEYDFPSELRITDLVVSEKGRFQDESSLHISETGARLSVKDLMAGRLVFESIRFMRPQIIFRRIEGRVHHALGGPEPEIQEDTSVRDEEPKKSGRGKGLGFRLPVEIRHLGIEDGTLQFIDYDIDKRGFVTQLHRLKGVVRRFSTANSHIPMQVEVSGLLSNGRNYPPAKVVLTGWYRISNSDTNTNFGIAGLWVPYFRPYYRKVTPSEIEDGVMDMHSTTVIEKMDWTTNARVDFRRLKFAEVESGNRILGLDATSFLDIIRGQAGQVSLDVIMRWDLKDSQMSFGKVLRRSLRSSFKSTFLRNLQNVLNNTLERIAEEGTDFIKKDWKNIIKKDGLEEIGGVVGQILDVGE